ncbi:MAG: baseplate assembly protein, partial [Lentisphaerae bacterium]|nr:baseplate assembly protein [Lentisphaerota bacterium]
MSTFNAIDLSLLPAPNVIEPLDYEIIFSAMLTDLQSKATEFSALVESDPAYKVLEVAAYRELMLRQRVNDAS